MRDRHYLGEQFEEPIHAVAGIVRSDRNHFDLEFAPVAALPGPECKPEESESIEPTKVKLGGTDPRPASWVLEHERSKPLVPFLGFATFIEEGNRLVRRG